MATETQIEAGAAAVRQKIDATGYGRWVSDDQCREVAVAVLEAVEISDDEEGGEESE